MYKKIAKVSALLVGKLSPDKRHEKQNYGYLSADLILQEAGKALANEGVVIIPGVTDSNVNIVEYDSYGTMKTRIDASVTFNMIITDGENELQVGWVGWGTDYSTPDKAIYKAITSGHKYFLMKLLNIGVGNTDSEHEGGQSPPPQAQQPRPPQPAPAVSDDQRKPTDKMKKKLWASGLAVYGDDWDAQRAKLVTAVTKNRTSSSKEITFAECKKLIDGIDKKANE